VGVDNRAFRQKPPQVAAGVEEQRASYTRFVPGSGCAENAAHARAEQDDLVGVDLVACLQKINCTTRINDCLCERLPRLEHVERDETRAGSLAFAAVLAVYTDHGVPAFHVAGMNVVNQALVLTETVKEYDAR
jgi:hypothetical protein